MGKIFSSRNKENIRRNYSGRNGSYLCDDSSITAVTSEFEVEGFQKLTPAHCCSVNCIAGVKPGLCLSGGVDKSVIVYDYLNGSVKQKWSGHEKPVTAVCYAERQHFVMSGSRDKTIHLWKCNEPSPVTTFEGHELVVTSISLDPSNSFLCSGSRDNSVRIWDLETGSCLANANISRNLVTSVCWAPDDSVIAQTSEDKELRLWDPRSFNVVHVFPKKQNILSCCAVSEDGLHCLSGSSGCNSTGSELTLWDLRQRKPLCEFRGHEQGVSGCVFLPLNHGGQQMVASCGADSTVRVWNVESKDCVGLFMLEGRGPVTGIAAYPDYSILASTFNQGIHLLSLDYTNPHYPQLKRKLQF